MMIYSEKSRSNSVNLQNEHLSEYFNMLMVTHERKMKNVFSFFKDFFLLRKQIHREREAERPSLCWFSPQMFATPELSQESGASLGPSRECGIHTKKRNITNT